MKTRRVIITRPVVRRKRTVQRSKLQVKDGLDGMSNHLVKIPRTMTAFADRHYCKLRFSEFFNLVIAASGFAISSRFRPTAAYDVDPAFASTATPGFAELAVIYGAYRVTWSRITVRFVAGGSTQPALCVVVPLNFDPGVGVPLATVQSWIGNSYAKSQLLGSAGSPHVTITSEMSTEKIYGSKMVYFDDNFSANTAAIPTNNWYWAIGQYTTSAVASQAVTYCEAVIDMGVEFFERREFTA